MSPLSSGRLIFVMKALLAGVLFGLVAGSTSLKNAPDFKSTQNQLIVRTSPQSARQQTPTTAKPSPTSPGSFRDSSPPSAKTSFVPAATSQAIEIPPRTPTHKLCLCRTCQKLCMDLESPVKDRRERSFGNLQSAGADEDEDLMFDCPLK